MKILFISAVLPYPLYSGGQIRMYNLLKRLGKKHEIHLFSFIRSEKENELVSHLRFCSKVTTVLRGRAWQPKYLLRTLTGPYPFLWSTYHNSKMLNLLSDEIAKGGYDLIHIEPGYVWPSIPTESRIPIVVSEHNIEHAVYGAYVRVFPVSPIRPLLSLDVSKMIRWEKRVWNEASHIITVSDDDRIVIGKPNVSVVPNGVDIKEFVYRLKKTFTKNNPVFLYVGNFRWMENRDAAEFLVRNWWPEILKSYPGAKLRIVGRNAPSGKYYVGNVEHIQDELNRADVMLAPIRIGGGTKYKILEAMASGLPVITTRFGIEGMLGQSGKHFLTAETGSEVLQAIQRLRDNPKRMEIVKNARMLIEKEYSWDTIAMKLNDIWTSQ